jgi:DcuC family C4-dicarboxylate transporter
MAAIMPYLAMLIAALAAWAIVKKYNPQMTLLFAGLVMVTLSALAGVADILPKGSKPTGSAVFDIIEVYTLISIKQISGIGFLILMAGGFSAYMEKIGAGDKLVQICIEPLRRFRNPYILLGMAFLVGHAIGLVLPSASGLAMLLVVAMYPLLVGLGISKISASTAIGCTLCMSYAPTSPMGLLAARTGEVEPIVYLIKYQLPVALPAIIAVTVALVVFMRYFDAREGLLGGDISPEDRKKADELARGIPAFYAVLPLLPLILLIVFSPLVWKTIVLPTPTAMIIGWIFAMLVDMIRCRSIRKVFDDGMAMFKGMSTQLMVTVSLVFVAEYFATGLKTTGLVNLFINSAKNMGLGLTGTTILLSLCIGLVTIMTGSGVAALSSLVGLAPTVSASLGGSALSMIVPMQFASEMLRPISPVSAVIIIVAGAAGVSPMALVKRTVIPCCIGMAVIVIANILFLS